MIKINTQLQQKKYKITKIVKENKNLRGNKNNEQRADPTKTENSLKERERDH